MEKKKPIILKKEVDIPKNIEQPSLFEINQSLDYIESPDGRYNGLKGEHHARMVVFTNFILGMKPILLKGSRSSGKCLVGDTKIQLCDGSLISIRDIEEGWNQDNIYIVPSYNNINMNQENKKIIAVEKNGIKPVYRIIGKSGRWIDVTSNHPILQYDGFKSIDNGLSIGDSLLIPKRPVFFGKNDAIDDAKLIAYFITEGGLTNITPKWTNIDPIIIADFKKTIKRKFGNDIVFKNYGITISTVSKTANRNKKNPVTDFLIKTELMNKLAIHKELPQDVFTYNKKTTAMLLKCMFSCDGTIYNKKNSGRNKTTIIEYCSSSPILAEQVRILLEKFGIIARLRKKPTKRHPTYILTVYTQFNAKYLTEIGFIGEKSKRNIIESKSSNNVDIYPKRIWDDIYQEMKKKNIGWKSLSKKCGLNQTTLRNSTKYGPKKTKLMLINKILKSPTIDDFIKINNIFFFDQIKDIIYLGEQETYDIEVDVNHNFLANGIVTHNTNVISVLSAFAKNPHILSKSSEKAEYNDADELNTATHILIPEINKVNEEVVEMLKDWGEGSPTQYKKTEGSGYVKTITISPKPFITSIADENRQTGRLGEELISRLTIVNTDSSTEQNIRVIKEKLKRAQNPYDTKTVTDKRIKELIEFVKQLPDIKEYTFIYLPGESVIDAIPPKFTDSRRDTEKYLDNTKGIALFHIKNRMVVDYKGKKNILITPEDAWLNHVIYNEILLQSALKAGPLERKILEIIKQAGGQLLSVSDIRNSVLTQGLSPSHDTIRKACDNLSEIGYLTRIEDVRPFKYTLTDSFTATYTGKIDWKKIVETCKEAVKKQFPEHADEYIKRFCSQKINVVHPFTGVITNIMEEIPVNEFSNIKPVKEEKKKPILTSSVSSKDTTNKAISSGPTAIQSQLKQDPIELLREKIIDILKKKTELTFEELAQEIRIDLAFEDEQIEIELNFLNRMNELLYKNGKVRILE